MEHNIEKKEHVERLFQNLFDSYDHVIINVTNGALSRFTKNIMLSISNID